MKCLHRWIEKEKKNYIDYSGYRVLKVISCCESCNKRRTQKYY